MSKPKKLAIIAVSFIFQVTLLFGVYKSIRWAFTSPYTVQTIPSEPQQAPIKLITLEGQNFDNVTFPQDTKVPVINGQIIYCNNCNADIPCTTGGTGAFAFHINNTWVCSK